VKARENEKFHRIDGLHEREFVYIYIYVHIYIGLTRVVIVLVAGAGRALMVARALAGVYIYICMYVYTIYLCIVSHITHIFVSFRLPRCPSFRLRAPAVPPWLPRRSPAFIYIYMYYIYSACVLMYISPFPLYIQAAKVAIISAAGAGQGARRYLYTCVYIIYTVQMYIHM